MALSSPPAGSNPISLINLTQILSQSSSAIVSVPSEESIISILHSRHRSEINDIYIGQSTLLHLNPLRPTEDLNDQSAQAYLDAFLSLDPSSARPHLYHLASKVFYIMQRTGKTQAVIYSGYSGSGKSTSMRLLTNQLIKLSHLNPNSPSPRASAQPQSKKLSQQLPHLFSLLSSFSQAQSAQNPNGSRLSTLLEIHFDDLCQLAGAKLLVFGLDRNRLRISPKAPRDRAFDVFYQLLAGISTYPQELNLPVARSDPSFYSILSSSSQSTSEQDSIGFEDLKIAFKNLGFKAKHVQSIYRVLLAILLMGNLEFEINPSRDYQDQSAFITNSDILETVSQLLGLEQEALAQTLTNKVSYIRKETLTAFLRPDQARGQRDDFTNGLYGILVAYVIETANHKLFPGDGFIAELQSQGGSSILQFDSPGPQGKSEQIADSGLSKRQSTLGGGNRSSTLLDQAGSFGASGYQEFCINFQTELLQTWQINRNFKDEEARPVADGISLPRIDLVDLSSSRLEMLRGGMLGGKADSKPGGIMGGLAKTCNSHRKGRYQSLEEADNDVLDGMRSHFASHSSFISRPNHSTSQSVFGIQHWSGPVSYDISGFVEADLGLIDVEFVTILRNSSDNFVSRLLSGPSLALDRHPLDPSVIVGAQVSSAPLRRPSPVVPTYPHLSSATNPTAEFDSTVSLIDTTVIQPTCSQLNATFSQILSHLNQCQAWDVVCCKSNEELYANDFVPAKLRAQLSAFKIPELVARKKVDYLIDFEFSAFSLRYRVDGENPADWKSQLASSTDLGLKDGKDFEFGRTRVWLTFDAFKTLERKLSAEDAPVGSNRRSIAGHLASVDIPGGSPRELEIWGDLGGGRSGSYQHGTSRSGSREDLLNSGQGNIRPISGYEAEANIPDSPGYLNNQMHLNDPSYDPTNFHDDATQSRVWGSEWESKPQDDNDNKEMQFVDIGLMKSGLEGDVGNHDSSTTEGALLKTDGINQTVEEVESSKSRRVWVKLVWLLTFWIPNFMLSKLGRMKRPDVQMAWREKVALCILIFFMCGMVLFIILGLGKVLCPNLAKAWNLTELGYHAQEDDYFVGIRGQVFDMTKFWKGQHSDILAQQSTNSDMLSLAGQDLTNYFPIPLKLACPNVQSDTVTIMYANWTATVPNAVHVSGSGQVIKTSALANETWYPGRFLPFMNKFYKGPIVYSHKTITELSQNRSVAVYKNGVYDLTDYLYTYSLQNLNSQFLYIDKEITDLFQQQPGSDLSKSIDSLSLNATSKSASMACLRNMFYLGETDFREGPKCTVANYILLAFTILIAGAIVSKFIAALQLGRKKMPELRDKFVICQVPCYTEGEESLRKTIDSLATLKYDDKRKLIFLICDGMIIGSGNDSPTPRIVLDILGVDQSIDPDPLLFQSVSEGSKQLNYGKVYSGLYEVDGHVVPYVVVVKVGKPTERSKPGNRGKRDSQILLMRFLNRVHFDAPMSPLELEICHQIKNVIGVEPQLYEFLFTIDADTEVYQDSLNRLVSAASDDGRIIGICGETKLSNEKTSWWTMIQVYEYYISHHLSKAFESLFGSVTCLPGCFTLYRIRSADKGRPLVVSNLVIDEYSEIHVDTLHKKNLFSLGEDRFFTTLLMKHFPHYKTKFISDATAMTAAPETWAVLLSQRRRWINSTIHNLGELLFLEDMCGFCCFSMRFFVILDLIGTVILPSTTVYIIYLIVVVSLRQTAVPIISLVIIAAVYGLQAVIFLLKREWGLVFWMIIYLMAYPIWSFFLPIYSFWHFDDFSWGNTRVVVGEGKHKKVLADTDDVGFDPSMIPLRKFADYQAAIWDDEDKSSRVAGGYPGGVGGGRRPDSAGGFSMASRPMPQMGMAGGGYAGSLMGAPSVNRLDVGGDYYRDGHPRSTVHSRLPSLSSQMNLGAPYNRSASRSPSQQGSANGHPAMGLNDFGNFQHRQSMMSVGGGPMVGPMGAMSIGPGSVRGSMINFMGQPTSGGMMMGPGFPGMVPMTGPGGVTAGSANMGGDIHSRNLSTYSMGGMMAGTPSMMMGGHTPSMMFNPQFQAAFGGGMGNHQAHQSMVMMNKNLSANPTDEEIIMSIRNYLSTQDLMKITKRSVREAISEHFPNADLSEKKAFVNEQVDKILAGN
ncbi:chitin synthase-domain-containing protein [Phakopsora pachyrhizi]|uniref:chitin synthase n=1 Tax=Phakopsora pachyrhizi TaxID=170000 RepID=A0AAV0BJG8_PHAPC|nr:chitin synthase-domain-containing protein [Phakopsora pachyrhizi]CAH7686592.1 chitin synthase-domain-containing protein [Phakopsora pachyrhizi]